MICENKSNKLGLFKLKNNSIKYNIKLNDNIRKSCSVK